MGSLAVVFLSVHTPRYCTLEAAFEGRLAAEVFCPVHAYGPSSGSGNYVISLLAQS
jgi:hypothetical protein